MSRWERIDPARASRIRHGTCVYVIYRDGAVAYVGKSSGLYMRLYRHRKYQTGLDFKAGNILVKASFDRRYGEHAMRELRLIAKLNPPLNKSHKLSEAELMDKPWVCAA